MKHYFMLALFIVLLSFFQVKGQSIDPEIVNTAGGNQQTVTVTISWSLGEPVIETFSNSSIILTQGFQQPFPSSIQSSIWSTRSANIQIYPNPAMDYLYIDLGKQENKNFRIELYDINGQLYLSKYVTDQNEVLNMQNYSQGTYLLRVITEKGYQTFKIIKQ